MAELLRLAGYSTVALTVPSGLLQDRVSFLRRIFQQAGIDTALRIDLTSTSRADLLRLLRRFRNSYDIVAVRCTNPNVSTVACRDRRVDVVFFDHHNQKVRFNHSFANLLRGTLEINLISIFLREINPEVYSRVAHEAEVAREHKVSVVLSSGCASPEMVRTPAQIAAVGCITGLSEEQSLNGVSEIPRALIMRNSRRRSREYIEEGVKIVLPRVG